MWISNHWFRFLCLQTQLTGWRAANRWSGGSSFLENFQAPQPTWRRFLFVKLHVAELEQLEVTQRHLQWRFVQGWRLQDRHSLHAPQPKEQRIHPPVMQLVHRSRHHHLHRPSNPAFRGVVHLPSTGSIRWFLSLLRLHRYDLVVLLG